jgi:hypothetical protein
MDIPKYAELLPKDGLSINYLCNIRDNKEYNIKYFESRKFIVLRNCDTIGNLSDLTLPKSSYMRSRPWVLLSVKEFTEQVCSVYFYHSYLRSLFTGKEICCSGLFCLQQSTGKSECTAGASKHSKHCLSPL